MADMGWVGNPTGDQWLPTIRTGRRPHVAHPKRRRASRAVVEQLSLAETYERMARMGSDPNARGMMS